MKQQHNYKQQYASSATKPTSERKCTIKLSTWNSDPVPTELRRLVGQIFSLAKFGQW